MKLLSCGQAVGSGGRFLLLSRLGQGGMGEVWLASDQELSREGQAELVALKFLTSELRENLEAMELVRKEVSRSQRLSHPNIVRIYDLHLHKGFPFIKMEYVKGNSLRHWLRQAGGVMPWQLAAELIHQLACALQYAHETEGIVHRDIKPANLLLSAGFVLKLADFGIAAAMHQPTAAAASLPVGTPWYASPQQLSGGGPTPADDVYALGTTLYEFLTGSLPFEADSGEELIQRIRYGKLQTIRQRLTALGRENEVPNRLAGLAERCLRKDPLARPSASEVSRILAPMVITRAPYLISNQDEEVKPKGIWKRIADPRRLIGLVLILFLTCAWYWNWGGMKDGVNRVRRVCGLLLMAADWEEVERIWRQPAELVPGPFFCSDMVLERSSRTLLWGWENSSGQSVWVRVNNAAPIRAQSSDGMWRAELDLAETKSPCRISVTVGRSTKPAISLTNVVLGHVWVVAVEDGQGIGAQPSDIIPQHTADWRCMSLVRSEVDPLNPSTHLRWERKPGPDRFGAYSTLALCLAERLAEREPAGIVELHTHTLLVGLKNEQVRSGVGQEEMSAIEDAWARANEIVRDAQADQLRSLTRIRSQTVTRGSVPITEYSEPVLYPAEAFEPTAPPLAWLTFRGAVYLGPPKRVIPAAPRQPAYPDLYRSILKKRY